MVIPEHETNSGRVGLDVSNRQQQLGPEGGEAIRRRFHLIPFAVTIPPEERVTDLAEKLRDEWPGILAWLIEGCLEWQTEGLRPPNAVVEATEAYLSAEDSLAAWIDEACARSPGAWEPSTELFGSWSNWANSAGEHPGSIKRFSQALESRGFTRIRQRRGGGNPVAGFDGLRLFQEPEPSWNDR